ncbi:MAG: glyoxylate/hydroxypyruvate reductase A [Bacteroidota bacterium]
MQPWKEALLAIDPHLDIDIWPDVKDRNRVTFAVCWNHLHGVLEHYPNLNAVLSLGAGADHLLNDTSIPETVKLGRIVTPGLKEEIADYVLHAVLSYRRNGPAYVIQAGEGRWKPHTVIPKAQCTVGVLGMGEMGRSIARTLIKNGYNVSGWSNSEKDEKHMKTYAGREQLFEFLSHTHILVCALPLTAQTEGILNLELFKQLQSPAYLINVGRGAHLIEEDLIYALDIGLLSGACLDVFEQEPLPESHVFWGRSNIMITPHVASVTPLNEASAFIADDYKRVLSGIDMKLPVNRSLSY